MKETIRKLLFPYFNVSIVRGSAPHFPGLLLDLGNIDTLKEGDFLVSVQRNWRFPILDIHRLAKVWPAQFAAPAPKRNELSQ